jgi:hypothetical protein
MSGPVRPTTVTSNSGSLGATADESTTSSRGRVLEDGQRHRWWNRFTARVRELSRRTWLIIAGAVSVVIAAVLVWLLVFPAAPTHAVPAAAADPVALTGASVPDDTRIGVIVTLGTGAEGSQWSSAAEGARVAQQRYLLGGTTVTLVTEDDHGTKQGAVDAVNALVGEEITGIIIATSGPHLDDALRTAADADIPVVLPYAPAPADAVTAWSLAPSENQTTAALTDLIADYRNPVLIDTGSEGAVPLEVQDRIAFTTANDPATIAADIAHRTGADALTAGGYAGDVEDAVEPLPVTDRNDAVLVSGHPVVQAALVAALQQRGITVPILLTPDALSPAFATALTERGGTPSTAFVTVGGAWSDAEALNPTAQGRAMSAFLAATRQFAASPNVTNLFDDAPFAETGVHADARSHDAVIALVEAIRSAESTSPAEVTAVLESLRLDPSAGIAGPSLEFRTTEAFAGELSVLRTTAQDLGLRPRTDDTPRTFAWFAEPHHD